jgi:regulator of replication initiation timing
LNLTKVKQLLERIISIHQEIDTLNEELKDIKTVVDEELPEVKWNNLNKVAKLKATQKLGETMLKMAEFSELVERLD